MVGGSVGGRSAEVDKGGLHELRTYLYVVDRLHSKCHPSNEKLYEGLV